MQVNIPLFTMKLYQREGKYSNSAQKEKAHGLQSPNRAKTDTSNGQPPTYSRGTHLPASQPKVGGRGGWSRSAEPLVRPNPWFGRTANSTAGLWPPRVDSNRPCNDGCAGPEPIHSSEPTCTRYKRRASLHFQIITYQEEEAPHSKAKLCFSYS